VKIYLSRGCFGLAKWLTLSKDPPGRPFSLQPEKHLKEIGKTVTVPAIHGDFDGQWIIFEK
jgi:hypothetical protein